MSLRGNKILCQFKVLCCLCLADDPDAAPRFEKGLKYSQAVRLHVKLAAYACSSTETLWQPVQLHGHYCGFTTLYTAALCSYACKLCLQLSRKARHESNSSLLRQQVAAPPACTCNTQACCLCSICRLNRSCCFHAWLYSCKKCPTEGSAAQVESAFQQWDRARGRCEYPPAQPLYVLGRLYCTYMNSNQGNL